MLPFLFSVLALAPQDSAPLSEATEECLACHEVAHPGIAADWARSRHARTTPAQALALDPLERRMSADSVPEEMRDVAVGCFECHGLRPDAHPDNVEHFGYRINVVVTPEDCRTCHPVEVEQYANSKKANALPILEENALFSQLVETVTGVHGFAEDGSLVDLGSSDETKNTTCYACHGSRVEVVGHETRNLFGQEVEFPILSNWPNQGVGRINPDGSKGSCSACHARHGFSIEVARKPYTCAQCHLAPDVPAWEVYHESKHGNLFLSEQNDYDWDAVPWKVGVDFKAPTCATCHNALLTTPDGAVIAERTHDFGERLWVRIFGLPYTHPQPENGRTWELRNADGQPLPTSFSGEVATEGLIDAAEQDRREKQMKAICNQCHSSSWSDGHFARLDHAIEQTDRMVLTSTLLMQKAWERGLADPANPFDEPLERTWLAQWLFYANSIRYAAAMGGPDYASFKNGWYELSLGVKKLERALEDAGDD